MRIFPLLALAVLMVACSPSEKRQAQQDLHKTGQAVKKELRNDAAFMKEQALKAREETQRGVKKLKQKMNEDHDRNSSPPPDR